MSVSILDPEWAAFRAGIKPALRVSIETGIDVSHLLKRVQSIGGHVARADREANISGRSSTVFYIAPTLAQATDLFHLESQVLPGTETAAAASVHRAIGLALGYPSCCVDAFVIHVERNGEMRDVTGRSVRVAEDYAIATSAWVSDPDPHLNHFLFAAKTRFISFYPCRYNCDAAVSYAQRVRALLSRESPAEVARDWTNLSRSVVIAADNARALVQIANDKIVDAVPPRDPNGRIVDDRDTARSHQIRNLAVSAGRVDLEVDGLPVVCVDFGNHRDDR